LRGTVSADRRALFGLFKPEALSQVKACYQSLQQPLELLIQMLNADLELVRHFTAYGLAQRRLGD
jgi:hypothetical protein